MVAERITGGFAELRSRVGGEWRVGSGEPLVVRSPATGHEFANGHGAGPAEVAASVQAAAYAQRLFREASPFERASLCERVADAISRGEARFAEDLAVEQGKTLQEAVWEVQTAARMYREAADAVRSLAGEVLPSLDPRRRIQVTREPIGVVAVITPWNFPWTIPSEYLSACLAVGNAVVWKPASYTPMAAVHLVECLIEAGVPDGVVNLVIGRGGPIADEMLRHRAVTAVGVTGSPATGEAIARIAGPRRLLLELGGNGPAIVCSDADLDRAIPRIARGCFRNAGQICTSTERILVHRSLHRQLVDGLVEEARRVRLGPSLDPGATMGPLNNEETARKVDVHLADARARGARILQGGGRSSGAPTSLYYEPTVIDEVPPDALISREETFGPVAPVTPFDTDEEALGLANDSDLGLFAGVFTSDMVRADYFIRGLEVGNVNVNEGPTYWQTHIPAGGFAGKRSGVGRLGGKYTMLELTQLKTITFDLTQGAGRDRLRS